MRFGNVGGRMQLVSATGWSTWRRHPLGACPPTRWRRSRPGRTRRMGVACERGLGGVGPAGRRGPTGPRPRPPGVRRGTELPPARGRGRPQRARGAGRVHQVPQLHQRADPARSRSAARPSTGRSSWWSPWAGPPTGSASTMPGTTSRGSWSARTSPTTPVQMRPPAHWSLAKSFTGFGPTGPFLVIHGERPRPGQHQAGLLRQRRGGPEGPDVRPDLPGAGARQPAVPHRHAVARGPDLHRHPVGCRLRPNATRFLHVGDVLTSHIEGIGELRNPCIEP